MGFLPKIEEILLLAIWKLKDNAYGITVIEQVESDTGTTWLSGSIYGALNRLKKNGYINTTKIEQSPEQRGRPRIYYKLSDSGLDKLISAQKVNKDVWQGVPDLEKAR
ncbi:PadR family transcriptional regulator [candidate division KSB1 bacterium]